MLTPDMSHSLVRSTAAMDAADFGDNLDLFGVEVVGLTVPHESEEDLDGAVLLRRGASSGGGGGGGLPRLVESALFREDERDLVRLEDLLDDCRDMLKEEATECLATLSGTPGYSLSKAAKKPGDSLKLCDIR